jgi:hypothetical protein
VNARILPLCAWIISALVLACGCESGASSQGTAPRYALACDSSDTRESSTLFCVRLDGLTGDVRRIDLTKIAVASGAGAQEGAYDISCDSTDTEQRSDFHCVRLDRNSGEVVIIDLPNAPSIPN